MSLPLKISYRSHGTVMVELTAAGMGIRGSRTPRPDLVVALWDALVTSLALEEIPLDQFLGKHGAARRVAEARAALQVRLRGVPS